ncbi:MAG: 1,6-anhydro-N-acetylmuramyl-L-alanine amidase AmpD [Gammaproteobacteria bacterium]
MTENRQGGIVKQIPRAWQSSVDRDGRVRGARWCPSPNCDVRPRDEISLLVIHAISLPPERFGGHFVEDLFLNRLDIHAHPYFSALAGVTVSAHLYINRHGALTQFVSLDDRAWHAGVSRHEGRERCNDFSIGIELEGCDTRPFTARQYQRLAAVTQAVMAAYPAITPERIVGHQDIAPGRKTDPGPYFDWKHYRELLA